jgi:hypothetical protein
MKLIKMGGVVIVNEKCGLPVIATLHDMLRHICNAQSGKPGNRAIVFPRIILSRQIITRLYEIRCL